MVAFISGGASGLGKATVVHLLSLGNKVAAADVNQKQLDELKNELNSDNLLTLKCDVCVEEEVKKAVEATV